MKKIIKLKESELLTLLEQQLNHPEKYNERKSLINSLKSAEYSLSSVIDKLDDSYNSSKQLPDEEMGITTKINKCYTEVRKELTNIRNILTEVMEGDKQHTQDIPDTEPEKLQQENIPAV